MHALHYHSIHPPLCSFGEAYSTLQPRITKTLVHAWLDTAKPLPTHYGAIRGLTGLGRHTIQLLILPNLPPYAPALDACACVC